MNTTKIAIPEPTMRKPTVNKGRRAFLRGATAAVALLGLKAIGCSSAPVPRTIPMPDDRPVTLSTVQGEREGFRHDLLDMREEMFRLGRLLEELRVRYMDFERTYGQPAFEALTSERIRMLNDAIRYTETFLRESRGLVLSRDVPQEEADGIRERFRFLHGLVMQQVEFIFSNSGDTAVDPHVVLERLGYGGGLFEKYRQRR